MISLHFCRAGRQQIGCVKWNLYRQERQQTSPIPYDYCIFAFSCLSISFSNVTSAGKKKGKDCRKHQEEDSVSSARNMNKRILHWYLEKNLLLPEFVLDLTQCQSKNRYERGGLKV